MKTVLARLAIAAATTPLFAAAVAIAPFVAVLTPGVANADCPAPTTPLFNEAYRQCLLNGGNPQPAAPAPKPVAAPQPAAQPAPEVQPAAAPASPNAIPAGLPPGACQIGTGTCSLSTGYDTTPIPGHPGWVVPCAESPGCSGPGNPAATAPAGPNLNPVVQGIDNALDAGNQVAPGPQVAQLTPFTVPDAEPTNPSDPNVTSGDGVVLPLSALQRQQCAQMLDNAVADCYAQVAANPGNYTANGCKDIPGGTCPPPAVPANGTSNNTECPGGWRFDQVTNRLICLVMGN
jgi:hypothetical protein